MEYRRAPKCKFWHPQNLQLVASLLGHLEMSIFEIYRSSLFDFAFIYLTFAMIGTSHLTFGCFDSYNFGF